MFNPEKPSTPPTEQKPEEKPAETPPPKEKPLIEVVTPIGAEGRKISQEEIEKSKRVNERIDEDKAIKEKLASGELISQREAARLRELELTRKDKEEKKEEKPAGKPEEKKEKSEEKVEKPEKTKEQVLIEARENFARAQLDKAETLKTVKKFKGEPIFNSVKPTDAEIIGKYDKQTKELADKGIAATLMTSEEKQAYYDALSRRQSFEEFFRTKGLNKEQVDKMYEDVIAHNKAKEQYQEALKGARAGMYEKALTEIEKLGLPEEKANELMRQKMEEIVKTTVVAEANNLYDTKTRISLEAKGDASFRERAWKTAGRAVEWYRKLPLKYKLMVSGGLLAGGVVAGVAGGATGAALAAGVVTGRWFQRAFGGAATAVGLEGLIKRSQEKRAEKKTFKEFGDKLSELIKTNDKSLNERLIELEGKKKSEKTRRYILAGAAGAVVASGLLGRAIHWGVEETGVGKPVKETIRGALEKFGIAKPSAPELAVSHGPDYVPTAEDIEKLAKLPPLERYKFELLDELSKKIGRPPTADELETIFEGQKAGAIPREQMQEIMEKMKAGALSKEEIEKIFPKPVEHLPYEAPPAEEYPAYEVIRGGPEIAGKGDSVWRIIERQMQERYGGKFAGLDEARKTYVIDALKDKVAVNPEKYGLTNIDQIQAGKTYDFLPGSKMEVDKIIGEAGDLKQAQVESILKHNRLIEEWAKSHPGERLTSDKVDEILLGKKTSAVLEALQEKKITAAEYPAYEAPPAEYPPYEAPPEELPGERVSEKIPSEELPGEYVPEKPAEVAAERIKGEVVPVEYESPDQIAAEMARNELANIRGIGFSEGEYKAIQNFKIGRLLELVASRDQAWEVWRGEDSLKLMEIPHDGFYGASEFKRHIRLAEFIRSFNPGDGIKEMTIQQFLRMVGPK